MAWRESEYVIIKDYNPATGIAQIDSSLSYYHFGAATSTASNFGIDMRGEVVLLSRNI